MRKEIGHREAMARILANLPVVIEEGPLDKHVYIPNRYFVLIDEEPNGRFVISAEDK